MKILNLQNSDLQVIVDDEDFERLSQFSWYVKGGQNSTIKRVLSCTTIEPERYTSFGYRIPAKVKIEYRSLSNEIMQKFDRIYDHKNIDFLDNRKDNLRECTHQQNSFNRRKADNPNLSSKYKGVSAKKNRWCSRIMLNGKPIHIGYFDTELEAALAYNKKAVELHGEFAKINII
jgi:predicted PolB exonuclease-like 3'-5' exonuclease